MCSILEEIAEQLNNRVPLTRSSSVITRSMSGSLPPAGPAPGSPAGGSSQTSSRSEQYEVCLTCMFPLDGLEEKMCCPKCRKKVHVTCFRGDGCQKC